MAILPQVLACPLKDSARSPSTQHRPPLPHPSLRLDLFTITIDASFNPPIICLVLCTLRKTVQPLVAPRRHHDWKNLQSSTRWCNHEECSRCKHRCMTTSKVSRIWFLRSQLSIGILRYLMPSKIICPRPDSDWTQRSSAQRRRFTPPCLAPPPCVVPIASFRHALPRQRIG